MSYPRDQSRVDQWASLAPKNSRAPTGLRGSQRPTKGGLYHRWFAYTEARFTSGAPSSSLHCRLNGKNLPRRMGSPDVDTTFCRRARSHYARYNLAVYSRFSFRARDLKKKGNITQKKKRFPFVRSVKRDDLRGNGLNAERSS